MYPAVKKVKPLEGYKLLLYFTNGEEKIFDASPSLNVGKSVELPSSPNHILRPVFRLD